MFLSGITLSAAPGLLLSRTVVLPGCTSTRNRWQLSRRQKVCGAHRGSVTDNGQYSLCFVCVCSLVCVNTKSTLLAVYYVSVYVRIKHQKAMKVRWQTLIKMWCDTQRWPKGCDMPSEVQLCHSAQTLILKLQRYNLQWLCFTRSSSMTGIKNRTGSVETCKPLKMRHFNPNIRRYLSF